MKIKDVKDKAKEGVKNKVIKTIVDPINQIVDENITDITTTIGSFIVRSIRGKFQRSITFHIGLNYSDKWMEEALYGILYEYNDIKKKSRLALTNTPGIIDGTGMYYVLDDGTHNLKYRNFEILLVIQTITPSSPTGRILPQKVYTIITYDLSPEFVKLFERDMILHRNSLLKIKSDAPTVSVYKDFHEGDGFTYWEKYQNINKRPIGSIFLPREKMETIVNTVNNFFASKEFYKEHGITHNLKILLYGDPGTGKDSIARMIASEWNRNIYYVTGGKDGFFVPEAITDMSPDVNFPLFIISDIDKYSFLINEPKVDITDEKAAKEEMIIQKRRYGNMINALDGILSGEDRIIIMTTNHIEKFGEAFLRPGRVDLKMEIGYLTPEVFRRYVYKFYKVELPEDIKLISDKLRVSDLQRDVLFMKLTADEFIEKYTKKSKK